MRSPRTASTSLLVAIALAAGAPAAHATLITDSISDFSGEQGAHNWYYGWVLPTDAPGSFREMSVFDGQRWWVDPEHYWTMLGPLGGHANGEISSGFASREEQWAVRRWVSPSAADIDVEITLRKLNINPSSNGVLAYVLLDGEQVWSRFASGTDSDGTPSHVTLSVLPGSRLDFILDPYLSNDWSDNTQLSAKITSIPAPGALAVLGVTALAARRRRPVT